MSDVMNAPAPPISRGPGPRTPLDSVSESYRPPRRPPSRSASRHNTPRGGPSAPLSPANASGTGRHPLSPDATAPRQQKQQQANGTSPAAPHHRPSFRPSGSSIQFAIDDDTTPGQSRVRNGIDNDNDDDDDQSIAFDVEPSHVPTDRRRVSRRTDDIQLASEAGTLSHRGESIDFMVESSVPNTHNNRNGINNGGASNKSADLTANPVSDIQFEVASSTGGDITFHMDDGTSGGVSLPPTRERVRADPPAGAAAAPGGGAAGWEPQTEALYPAENTGLVNSPPLSASSADLDEAVKGDDREEGEGHGAGRPVASAPPADDDESEALAAAHAAADTAAYAAAAAAGPPRGAATATATVASTRTGRLSSPRKVAPARRQETKARETVEKPRVQLINERPWRTASPRNASTPTATPTREAASQDGGGERTRAQVMNDRPWRAAATSPQKRAASNKAVAAAATDSGRGTPVRTRAELMSMRPWRDAPPRTSRDSSPRPINNKKRTATPAAAVVVRRAEPVQAARATPQLEAETQVRARAHGATQPPPEQQQQSDETPTDASPRTPGRLIVKKRPDSRTTSPAAAAAKNRTTAPPVLLRSPWVVLGAEAQDWADMASQTENVRQLLSTMRAREREVTAAELRIAARAQDLAEVEAELYTLRDERVQRTGVDLNGDALRPPNANGNAGSSSTSHDMTPRHNSGRSPSRATTTAASETPEFALRLYPQELQHSPRQEYYRGVASVRHRQLSVLSDEDVSDGELEANAEAVEEWARQRADLHARKIRLVHQGKDLRFHLRRGTHIKNISALTVTSSMSPLARKTRGAPSAQDEHGYDVLARLRLDAAEADQALAAAREGWDRALGAGKSRSKGQQQRHEDLRESRQERRAEYREQSRALADAVGQAWTLNLVLDSRGSGTPEEIDRDDDDSLKSIKKAATTTTTAPTSSKRSNALALTAAERNRDAAAVVAAAAAQAQDALDLAKARQFGTREAARRNRSRSATRR